jgi:hypothetical protein
MHSKVIGSSDENTWSDTFDFGSQLKILAKYMSLIRYFVCSQLKIWARFVSKCMSLDIL